MFEPFTPQHPILLPWQVQIIWEFLFQIIWDLATKEERQIISEITKIIQHSDIIRANTVTMSRVCGNKNCRCTRGEKHVSLYLSRSSKGKQRLTYIPVRLEEETNEQVRRYQRVKDLMDQLLEINWKRLVERKLT